jgi:hypothetical protein
VLRAQGWLTLIPVAGAVLLGTLAPSGPAQASTLPASVRHASALAAHQPAPRAQAGVAGRSRIAPEALLHHSTQAGRHAGARPAGLPPADGSDLGAPLPLGNLPLGTYVTSQFADDGIIFSGQSPFITDDSSSDVNPVMSGSPQFQGTIVGTFVEPGTQTPATLDAFSVDVGYIDNPGSVEMTVYGSQGEQLGVLVATQSGFNQLYSTFPGAASFSVSTVAGEPNGWELNTIQLGGTGAQTVGAGPDYIAMGDSYSSGEGTGYFPWSKAQNTQCDTGPLAWPVQLAGDLDSTGATLSIDQNTLVACQGERTYQLSQAVNGESASELAQVTNFVKDNGHPNLLTITIGGNNLGFADILQACFLGGTEICLREINALNNAVTTGAPGLIASLASTYSQVLSAADGGSGDNSGDGPQVDVVGYPDLFPQPGGLGTALSVTYHCPWLRDSYFPVLTFVSPRIDTLLGKIANAQAAINDDMAAAAAEAGVQFIAIPDSLAGHELCTGTSYINALSVIKAVQGNRNIGHPNVAGQTAIASEVAAGLTAVSAGPNHPAGPSQRGDRRPRHETHRASGPVRPGIRPQASGPLSFSGGQLQDGTVGSDYIDYLVATGGNGADTWSVTSGSLPPGLTLDPDAGTITGTPTSPADATFTVQASDSSSPPQTASAPVTIDVAAATALAVGPAAPPDATVGQPYTFQLPASGGLGQLSWAVISGALPAGLHLDATTGQLTGTPTTAGDTSFTLQATDSSSPAQVAAGNESLTVDPAADPLAVTTTSLPELAAGQDYGAQLTSTGGVAPVTWSVPAGSLPPGLSLDPGSGVLSGVPAQAGTYDFTVQASDGSSPSPQTATAALSVTIDAPPALTIATAGAFDGTEGAYYSSTFQATGGVGPYSWSVSSGSLPSGLGLDEGTGQVTGTPASTGDSTFEVTVSDAAGDTATQAYSVDIAQVPLTVSPSLAPATVGTYYTGNVAPSGGLAPYGWSLVSGTLPDGLSFDPSTGAITGTPAQSGTFRLKAAVADSSSPSQQVTARLTLTVSAAPALIVTGGTAVQGAVGDFYAAGIGYSGGQGPYTWAVTAGSLPPGLSIDPGSGMVAGTPTTAGSYPVTVQATDSSTPTPEVATAPVTFVIGGTPSLEIASTTLPAITQGVSYSTTLQASGGVPPYTWDVASGTLPAGLELDSSTGELYGTPTGDGSKTVTLEVADSQSTPATAKSTIKLTVTGGAALSIITTGLDEATQQAPYDEPLTAAGGSGSYTWSVVQGSLPAGLELDPSGAIEGAPVKFGTSTFTLEVTDSSTPTPKVAKEALSLDVDPIPVSPPSFTADSPPSPTPQNDYYSYQFSAAGNPAPDFSVSSGQLPAGLKLTKAGVLSGTVTKAGTFTFEVTAANGQPPAAVSPELTLQVIPPPVISSFTPSSGVPGAQVQITGKNLATANAVYFDGSYAAIKSASSTRIVTSVPEYAGSGVLYVFTAGGEVTSAASFTVDPAPAPAITSISPLSGAPGSTLTINGSGLEFASAVEFGGGVYVDVMRTDTPSKITLRVPSGASAGPLTVSTDGGSATSTQTFTPTG